METTPEYHVRLEEIILDLLARVVARPRESLLEPPVPLEMVKDDLEKLRTHSALHIEQASRSCVYRIANNIGVNMGFNAHHNGKQAGSVEFTMAYAYDFLDILLLLSETNVTSDLLVPNMIEEFVDCTVIEIGKLIFEYMQSRSSRIVEGFHPTRGKGPILLRTTNELKRRLSRETDAAFIGRIMIFISLLLPPWERSGVNLRGNYNVESITKYEEPEKNEDQMDIDDDNSTDAFYVKFWSLQKYLKNPTILHSQDVLEEFKPKLDFVINKFFGIESERLKLRGQAVNNNKTSSAEHKMDIVIGSEEKSEYYPGFLKSRQLFDLQMADSKFRRTLLFQIMVVMRHLLSLTMEEKEKRDTQITTPNKVVLYPFTLSSEDAKWATQKDKEAYNLTDLAFQPHPQHRTFSKAVRAVLDRDEAWVRWKENGCPAFQEPSWTEDQFDAMEKRLRQITAPLAPYRFPMGNQPLSDLWRDAGDLTMESLQNRVQLPTPEEFVTEELDRVKLEEMTPAEQVERIDEKASSEWRGLRLAMRYDMDAVLEAKGSLTKYVESKKGVKEIKEDAKDGKEETKEVETKDEEMADVDEQMVEVRQPENNGRSKAENNDEEKGEAMDVQNES